MVALAEHQKGRLKQGHGAHQTACCSSPPWPSSTFSYAPSMQTCAEGMSRGTTYLDIPHPARQNAFMSHSERITLALMTTKPELPNLHTLSLDCAARKIPSHPLTVTKTATSK